MLTAKEKRFIRYWEEQRKGGKWKYFLLYIPIGTFISSVVIAFLMSMLLFNFVSNIPFVVITSFVIITLVTALSWEVNENKFKKIIRREVKKGRSKDEQDKG